MGPSPTKLGDRANAGTAGTAGTAGAAAILFVTCYFSVSAEEACYKPTGALCSPVGSDYLIFLIRLLFLIDLIILTYNIYIIS